MGVLQGQTVHEAVFHLFGCVLPSQYLRYLVHGPRRVSCWAGLSTSLFQYTSGN